MSFTRRSKRLVALAVGLSLIAAACGDDDDADTEGTSEDTATDATEAATDATEAATDTTEAATDTTEAATDATEAPTDGTDAPAEGVAMTVTIPLNPDAVWDDGTPIGVADFQCVLDATMNTPGSLTQVGYEKIVSIEEGADASEIVVSFSEVYAPYKNLFYNLIKADAVADCTDVSAEFGDSIPFSGTQWKLDSWSLDQAILVPNEAYWGPNTPTAAQVVIVPKADADTEIASLKSGEVDFIFPQAFAGITTALDDPNITFTAGYGTNYEGIYFQQLDGPLADDTLRAALSKSIDREAILAGIYDPIFPGAPLLQCGLWVPTIGDWCDDTIFTDSYDPEGAVAMLEEAGWTKDGDGYWADPETGEAPVLRWMVNTPNPRRESTQALLIPLLQEAGFNVVADNCDAACTFQQRLPALDYDIAMYIQTVSPDPTVGTIMSCDAIPTPENDNTGQNSTGWCNEEATALMDASDQEVDVDARVELIHQIGALLAEDSVMLSLFQFPNIAAWRTDRLSGPIDADAGNYFAWQNVWEWVPETADQIIVGAEQWPECLNPITECANSSWYQWTTAFKVLPTVWITTSEGTYEPTELVSAEPTVEVL